MVTDGKYTYLGEHFEIYINVESLCGTSEMTVLFVKYAPIKKERERLLRSVWVGEHAEVQEEWCTWRGHRISGTLPP